MAAWVLAKYAAGQADPYFAPLAALLGVYPTVARSLREGAQYVAGFLLGAALAVPVGMLLGPGIAGVGIVVLAGVLISSWRRLGDQSAQVTFTALFALLLGGYQPLHYVTHRMVEVAIGVITGLVVNIVVFPPLQLRPAEHAIRLWVEDIAGALEALAEAAADPSAARKSWTQHDRELTAAVDQARAAARHARESLRWNPRARGHQALSRPDDAVLDSLEGLTVRTRAVARLLVADPAPAPSQGRIPAPVVGDLSVVLRLVARAARQLADQHSVCPAAKDLQHAAAALQRDLSREAGGLSEGDNSRTSLQRLCGIIVEMVREVTAGSS